jgi:hypothetical protein
MIRTFTAVAAAVSLLAMASNADAQAKGGNFGDQGQFILSADRLVPVFAYTRVAQNRDPGTHQSVEEIDTQTSLSLFWGQNYPTQTFYNVPRFGFDYTVIPSLTVGGNIIFYATLGGSTDTQTVDAGVTSEDKRDAASVTIWGIAPRVGYIIPIGDMFAIWPRGGPAYYHQSAKTTVTSPGPNPQQSTETTSTSQFALSIDPQFVITPFPHFGIMVGPAIDIPISGSVTHENSAPGATTSKSYDSSEMHIGLTAGLLGYF